MLQEHHFHAMNTEVGIWLSSTGSADAPRPEQCLRWAENFFMRVEDELSRFRPQSSLSRLNATAGTGPQVVSPVLWTVLALAMKAAEATDGIFDPTLLRRMESIGYDCSFEEIQPNGEDDCVAPRLASEDWRSVRMDAFSRSVGLPADVGIDLGGIAKGWTVDQVAMALARYGPVLVDAGGDLRVIGLVEGEPWPIAIQDPFVPEQDRGRLRLTHGALATSSTGGRRWQRNGRIRHHILDPRTGMPAGSDLHTATVFAPDAWTADVAAKVVLVLGSTAGAAHLRKQGFSGLLTRSDGTEIVVGNLPQPNLQKRPVSVVGAPGQASSSDGGAGCTRQNAKAFAPDASDMPAPGSVLLSALIGMVLAAGGFAVGISASGLTGETTSFWFLSRASGFVSYLLLWASVVWGLLLSTRSGRRWMRPAALLDAHRFLGNMSVGFGLFHGLILMGDRYVGFPLRAVLMPFAGNYEPLLVAGGQIGVWLSVLLIASFYLRRHIGAQNWRRLHYVSFVAYWAVFVHGYTLGSDSKTIWASSLYLATAGSVVFLTLHRVLANWTACGIPARPPALRRA